MGEDAAYEIDAPKFFSLGNTSHVFIVLAMKKNQPLSGVAGFKSPLDHSITIDVAKG